MMIWAAAKIRSRLRFWNWPQAGSFWTVKPAKFWQPCETGLAKRQFAKFWRFDNERLRRRLQVLAGSLLLVRK